MAGSAIAGAGIGIPLLLLGGAGGPFVLAGFFALPLSIGVAVLRYRLFDIDRIISRTLAYAIVTGLLVGVYAGIVLLATRVVSITAPVAVAASTLAAAALFNPLRRRVQRVVDRRFNRARYDANRTVTAFAARLQDTVNLDSVRDDVVSAVPRLLCFYGENEPLPDPVLTAAREALDAHYGPELGEPFRTAGLCLYRDGRDSVAWHGDRIGRGRTEDTMVAILSLGTPRALLLRPHEGASYPEPRIPRFSPAFCRTFRPGSSRVSLGCPGRRTRPWPGRSRAAPAAAPSGSRRPATGARLARR